MLNHSLNDLSIISFFNTGASEVLLQSIFGTLSVLIAPSLMSFFKVVDSCRDFCKVPL